MVDAAPRFYITTAIDYPNAPPHIGHALEKVFADVVARYHRLRGDDTYLSMGLDENSQHVVAAAAESRVPPREWLTRMDEAFQYSWSRLDVSYDWWMRTTNERHFRASQELFQRAHARGDIYKSVYSGWYCPNCNNFFDEQELKSGRCPNHPTLTPEWLEEENYFFALVKYADALREHIDLNPGFIVPDLRRNEVLGWLRQGLRDFSVSRLARQENLVEGQPWGVPVPGDPSHVIYVWFDALTNYLTAVGFPDDLALFKRYWPADVHVIGKDITRFHCLYWPAMLLSAGIELPRQIAVHGFCTLEGQRISKTTGNVIYPPQVADEYGSDAVRYYLTRDVPFDSDGDFAHANLIHRFNSDLANDLGNLLNRTGTMIGRYAQGAMPQPGEEEDSDRDLRLIGAAARRAAEAALEQWDFDGALDAIWALVRRANQYLEENEPWRMARDVERRERVGSVLYRAAEALRLLTIFLWPFMPRACDAMRAQLGLSPVASGQWAEASEWGQLAPGLRVPGGDPVFPRLEATRATPTP